MEVSRTYVVRPMRQLIGGWVLAWALLTLALLLVSGWWLSRDLIAPLERLAARVADAAPGRLPQGLAAGLRDDEVGALARRFDALLARTQHFITREQDFTRDASHELRTPLSVLRMATERLQADPALPTALRQQLLPMGEAVELMEQTVDSLLLLAREETPAAATAQLLVAPLPIIERWVLAHSAWLDEQRMTLDLRVPADHRLQLHEPALRIVLATLLSNALAHGTPGGVVRIDGTAHRLSIGNASPESDPPPAGLAAAQALAPADARRAGSGLSLGLSIARRLLERHGGRLDIEQAGGTTCVTVSDPGAEPHLIPS